MELTIFVQVLLLSQSGINRSDINYSSLVVSVWLEMLYVKYVLRVCKVVVIRVVIVSSCFLSLMFFYIVCI